jgi:membrane glycosyltransferase
VLGFWNSLIGLVIAMRRGTPESVAILNDRVGQGTVLKSRIAVAMAIRNEDPARAFSRLMAIRTSLDRTGQGRSFDLFILSDTDNPMIAAEEEALFAANRSALDGFGRATYRRRTDNAGYKAGNVWEFLTEFSQPYRFFVPLDADSAMGGETILHMCRIMEATPRLGILQSLAVGAPADSVFGRVFQFGMRHGMLSFTLGSAWWQGDCGPFWGHNAVIRTAAFKAHCRLPELGGKAPWGGPLLSHDQIEAVLMRRGGYEVRVLPVETESYEDNPVSILDFMTREQRWMNGNMQYWRLLGMPGLPPVSRFQLVQAILMYLSGPAWMLLTFLGMVKVVADPTGTYDNDLGVTMFMIVVGMSLAPKLFGAIAVAVQPGGMGRYGGKRRFAKGVAVETLFSLLMSPAVALRLTIFLGGLLLGKRIRWNGQERDAHGISWATAARELWPQTLFGMAMVAVFALTVPPILLWSAPIILGLVLAVPFAVITASPRLGQRMAEARVCAIPEEREMPDLLVGVEKARPLTALSA